MPLRQPPSRYNFPDAETGLGPQGVIGVGGDFSPGTILAAYHHGIFPWPAPELGVVLWCSPDPRAIFPLDAAPHWSRSLRRSIRKKPFRVTVDQAFAEVMAGCADRAKGTWITDELQAGYVKLHAMGWAHSVEVWSTESGLLVGGIYGLGLGAAFTAESMFHRETDASKVAFVSLIELLRPTYQLFDAQVSNPHLTSLGCVEVPRAEFLGRLGQAVRVETPFPR